MTRLSTRQTAAVARLRDAVRTGGLDQLPDADLLERFARYGEHPAFEVLLRRHGPMVFGVCRRVLANPADAEDAFQATFLVLVRRARSVRRGDRLGPWLYGVAFKVSVKARARAARPANRPTEATDMIPDPNPPAGVPDWLPILDAELSALPAKYREPLVLCELQGASRTDAAKALGIPEGTLSSRLSRGRELLRRRLLKHGTLLPSGGVAALFAANGVGRAAVPAGLIARTSEVVATGAALAGAVPAGAARLTDEVLRGMLFTKLRLAAGAVLALTLAAIGVAAAVPGEDSGRPESPTQSTTVKALPLKPPAPPADGGTVVSDRAAIQGLWVLDRADATKGVRAEERELKEMVGKMRFLVAGDEWWFMIEGSGGNNVFPQVARLDPRKNPKWLDLRAIEPHGFQFNRCTYELTGDRLRLCAAYAGEGPRPAEFNPEDDSRLLMLEFRREQPPAVPPAAKPLQDTWLGPTVTPAGKPGEQPLRSSAMVWVRGGFVFLQVRGDGGAWQWTGGRYRLDDSKIPHWIDVELVAPIRDGKLDRLYGSYEVADGQLQLALGLTGKRAERPLALAERPLALEGADDVMYYCLKPSKEPLVPTDRAVREEVPAPRVKPKDATDPDAEVHRLMKAREFERAADVLRVRLAQASGIRAAEMRLLLAVCMIERSKDFGEQGAATVLSQAQGNLTLALKELDSKPAADDKGAARVRAQCDVRTLQILQKQGKAKELLAAAEELRPKYAGTAEELVILSFVYHAYKQRGQSDDADLTRERMRALFGKLKEKPDAFPEKEGEFSRDYWQKTWFGEGK